MKIDNKKCIVMKYLIFLLIILTLSFCAHNKKMQNTSKIKTKLIKNDTTAIKLAEIILFSTYGERINKSRPFKAKLSSNIWRVNGTLNYDVGGVPYIEFRADDCKVIKIGHSK